MRARYVSRPVIGTVTTALVATSLVGGCAARTPAVREGSGAPPTSAGAVASPSAKAPSSPSARSTASPSPSIDRHASPSEVMSRVGDVPVLCYHQIRAWTADDSEQARAYIMPPDKFRAQMRYLDEHGYHPISPDRLLAHLTTGAKLPSKPILLTFDDSDENQITNALPVLKSHDFTATFFIMTVVLGGDDYMTEDQLRGLDDAGMTLGLHTWDHHRVDHYSGDDWHKQIAEPTEELEEILGHPTRYFAYPYGAWDDAAFSHLDKNGYLAAFQLTADPVSKKAPLYTLPRTLANPYWDMDEFAGHLDAD